MRLKLWPWVVMVGFSFFINNAQAKAPSSSPRVSPPTSPRVLGLGLVLGEPTGLTANYYYAPNTSIALALGWGDDDIQIHADHLWVQRGTIHLETISIDTYVGLGAKLVRHDHDDKKHDDHTSLSLRVPLGLHYTFAKAPVQLYGELVPTLRLIKSTDFDVDFAVGARYYF